mmetsp:Transcript_46371/g.104733  ORF Transcript_46371/g.104733 Transcript_46371/m.104733 type:complete len:242 (-) Transcript_46371:418-1143(-)
MRCKTGGPGPSLAPSSNQAPGLEFIASEGTSSTRSRRDPPWNWKPVPSCGCLGCLQSRPNTRCSYSPSCAAGWFHQPSRIASPSGPTRTSMVPAFMSPNTALSRWSAATSCTPFDTPAALAAAASSATPKPRWWAASARAMRSSTKFPFAWTFACGSLSWLFGSASLSWPRSTSTSLSSHKSHGTPPAMHSPTPRARHLPAVLSSPAMSCRMVWARSQTFPNLASMCGGTGCESLKPGSGP